MPFSLQIFHYWLVYILLFSLHYDCHWNLIDDQNHLGFLARPNTSQTISNSNTHATLLKKIRVAYTGIKTFKWLIQGQYSNQCGV